MKSSEAGPESSRQRVIVPRFPNPTAELAAALAAIRSELELPTAFPPEVEREAAETVAAYTLPELDLTDIEFVTIDPEGATDLDQAVHCARSGDGYVVHYAIADVPAFVVAGAAVDAESRVRGQTLYGPDGRIPLHPTSISEDAASLLENKVRGAYVWTMTLDATAAVTSTTLARAQMRSRHQYAYPEVQQLIDGGDADESLQLLKELGLARIALERERGGASLNRPDEEVEVVDGRYVLVRRSPLPVEEWNAQISLMTGMAAAEIMLEGRVGILRTMPAPQPETLERFRLQVAALGCPWPAGQPYGEYLRALDRNDPRALAAIHAATSLFRGAGYTAFDGELPEITVQAAVAAPYAHTTAPLRRLVDRFVLVTCEALANGRDVPQWVRDALPTLPKAMGRSDQLASRLEHASVDAIEAALLAGRVGEQFDAVVISDKGVIQLTDPVVTANAEGDVRAGSTVKATLVTADIATGTTLFRV